MMLHQLRHLQSTFSVSTTFCHHMWRRFEKPLTGAFLTLALCLTAGSIPRLQAHSAEVQLPSNSIQTSEGSNVSAEGAISKVVPDGIYLYGQSPETEQVGSAYLIFEASDRSVVGAFYMPHSSFDCVYGELQTERLALTVVDSYDQISHSHSLLLQRQAVAAAVGDAVTVPIELVGYHPIETISQNDQQILATCKANQPEI
ncbi:MAG: hypothetical protein F6K19_43975 [Cyanothece sp. SIO1E1]|nr:hypothetical protein [Cyanothece sp. SIO1E1]